MIVTFLQIEKNAACYREHNGEQLLNRRSVSIGHSFSVINGGLPMGCLYTITVGRMPWCSVWTLKAGASLACRFERSML